MAANRGRDRDNGSDNRNTWKIRVKYSHTIYTQSIIWIPSLTVIFRTEHNNFTHVRHNQAN